MIATCIQIDSPGIYRTRDGQKFEVSVIQSGLAYGQTEAANYFAPEQVWLAHNGKYAFASQFHQGPHEMDLVECVREL